VAAPASPGGLAGTSAPEQTRARYPDEDGYVERDGVRIFWERYGDGERTVLLLPTWSIVPSRFWKLQIPYLARHCRVVTFDGRGSGRSDGPVGAEANSTDEFAADALAVMDATGTERATLVTLSCGALWGTILAANHAERVDGIVYIGPAVRLAPGYPERDVPFDVPLDTDEGWAKYNSYYWKRDYPGFLEFFFRKCFTEPHSTKQIEDCIAWALETTPETLADATRGIGVPREEDFADMCARIRCPVLVIHGDHDQVRPLAQGWALAQATGGELVTVGGAGHIPNARDPVKINSLLRDFISPPGPPRRWTRASARRRRRALYISSPIGLGHARRDVAIADELRKRRPDLEIDWLAQHPVTEVLAAHGERIHPASAELAGESPHIQSEAREHELNVFQAFRRMDEILLSNFMVFEDLVREERYDLWIGDEAWELDYFLHENPELKTSPYAWLSDFVGWLPMPDGGDHEAALTADYNADMLEQIARYPRVRDLSLFVGDPDDVVPNRFGDGLPPIREWTERHFRFTGYITGFDPSTVADREALRDALGYRAGERVCIATVGGSGVGEDLLRRVIASYPQAKRLVPDLRMIVVAGPRIDPRALPSADGLEIRPYVHDLYRHLAACDLALVQGGLTTTMELTANQRPFIYFPLARHFEQNLHVRHRLERYRAGRRMDYADSPPDAIAAAIAEEIDRPVDYVPVATDGASRAAGLIAELL
jgi:pimeloyl-ACP methyl ester carboxylesterase/predicted glycosyltransferase